MEIETPCTCGHAASSHNSLGVCFAPMQTEGGPNSTKGLCPCPDFTSDDTAVAEATGVLEDGGAR